MEFGNDEDFKKFIDLPEIPKFREEGDEMLKMTKSVVLPFYTCAEYDST